MSLPTRVAGALYRRIKLVGWYARKTRFGVEWLRDVAIDLKYGGYCGGHAHSKFREVGAHGTASTDYYQLDKLFGEGGVQIRPDDVLVDVGSGKGRILNYWLHRGFRNRIYGLELDPGIAARAAKRLRKFPNVAVIGGDALINLPADATVIFMFNPFDAAVMQLFKHRVKKMFRSTSVRIVYFNCKFAHVFQNDPELNVQELHLNTFYPAILIAMRQKAASMPEFPKVSEQLKTLR